MLARAWLAMVVGCATAPPVTAPPPDPPLLAPPPPSRTPLPAYGGAVRLDECVVALEPASHAEQSARREAMFARLPPDTHLELDELGARARMIVLRWSAGPVKSYREARARAYQFLRDTAELWGITNPVDEERFLPGGGGRETTFVEEIDVHPEPPVPPSFHGHPRIVVAIDAHSGRLGALFLDVPDPPADVCPIPSTPPDDHFLDAAIAADPQVARADLKPPWYLIWRDWDKRPVLRLVVLVEARDRVLFLDPKSGKLVRTLHNEWWDRVIDSREDARPLLLWLAR